MSWPAPKGAETLVGPGSPFVAVDLREDLDRAVADRVGGPSPVFRLFTGDGVSSFEARRALRIIAQRQPSRSTS